MTLIVVVYHFGLLQVRTDGSTLLSDDCLIGFQVGKTLLPCWRDKRHMVPIGMETHWVVVGPPWGGHS